MKEILRASVPGTDLARWELRERGTNLLPELLFARSRLCRKRHNGYAAIGLSECAYGLLQLVAREAVALRRYNHVGTASG